jgi:hypothetical protein
LLFPLRWGCTKKGRYDKGLAGRVGLSTQIGARLHSGVFYHPIPTLLTRRYDAATY